MFQKIFQKEKYQKPFKTPLNNFQTRNLFQSPLQGLQHLFKKLSKVVRAFPDHLCDDYHPPTLNRAGTKADSFNFSLNRFTVNRTERFLKWLHRAMAKKATLGKTQGALRMGKGTTIEALQKTVMTSTNLKCTIRK